MSESSSTSRLLENLLPGQNYSIFVGAQTRAGRGPFSRDAWVFCSTRDEGMYVCKFNGRVDDRPGTTLHSCVPACGDWGDLGRLVMNPTNPAGCQLERNNERRLGLFALSQKPEGRQRRRRRMGELDMDGRRRMEGRGRKSGGE